MTETSEPILIVGAGPAGSMLAALLAEDGFDVEVIDKRRDPREEDAQSGRSINLTMAARGLAALRAIGAEERVLQLAVPLYGRVIHYADGHRDFAPYGHQEEAIYAIRRHELTAILVDVAESKGAKFVFRASCQDVDLETPSVRIRRAGHEPEERTAKLLVAADGAYSTIRNRMQHRLRFFNFSQRYSRLEYAEFIVTPSADADWADNRHAVHIWPRGGYMLIGFPNLDGSMTLSLQIPREGPVSHAAMTSPAELARLFKEQFPDVATDAAPMLEEYFERPNGTMITIRCSPWALAGRVLLIGDACHAIFPSYGQGCNSSFEDAIALRAVLRDSGEDWEEALSRYEADRRPEADAIADLSIAHFDVLNRAVADPNDQLAAAIALELQKQDPSKAPLYHNVSFTCMRYTEALRRESDLEALVRDVMRRLAECSMEEAVRQALRHSNRADSVHTE